MSLRPWSYHSMTAVLALTLISTPGEAGRSRNHPRIDRWRANLGRLLNDGKLQAELQRTGGSILLAERQGWGGHRTLTLDAKGLRVSYHYRDATMGYYERGAVKRKEYVIRGKPSLWDRVTGKTLARLSPSEFRTARASRIDAAVARWRKDPTQRAQTAIEKHHEEARRARDQYFGGRSMSAGDQVFVMGAAAVTTFTASMGLFHLLFW